MARIVDTVSANFESQGFATGFLVAPDLLMTNWHVFPTRGNAQGCGANFLYEQSERGLSPFRGGSRPPPGWSVEHGFSPLCRPRLRHAFRFTLPMNGPS